MWMTLVCIGIYSLVELPLLLRMKLPMASTTKVIQACLYFAVIHI